MSQDEGKEEHKKSLEERLEMMGQTLSGVVDYRSGADCMERPPKGLLGLPEFGDLVQIIDFQSEEAAAAYPQSAEHQALAEDMGSCLQKVVAIDLLL